MKYPTRKQIERLYPSEACNQVCDGCDIEKWCGDNNPDVLESMLAMHDVIDAKRAELDKAENLIREMLPYVKYAIYGEMTPVHFCEECLTIEPFHEPDCPVGKLISEAEAMAKGTL